MRPQTFDSTAGERARKVSAHPEARQRIVDATNPRYGKLMGDRAGRAGKDPKADRRDPERDALAA